MTRVIIAILVLVMAATMLTGCGENPTGVCVWGAGSFSARCWDGKTEGQCNMLNGTWAEGSTTCSDLGYGKSGAPSIVMSEIHVAADGSVAWVEILNAGRTRQELDGFALVGRNAAGQDVEIALAGDIHPCGTFVIGVETGSRGGILPMIDQEARLEFMTGKMTYLALKAPGFYDEEAGVISALAIGGADIGQPVRGGAHQISEIPAAKPGHSIERNAWPDDQWSVVESPDPNAVSMVHGCTHDGRAVVWPRAGASYR